MDSHERQEENTDGPGDKMQCHYMPWREINIRIATNDRSSQKQQQKLRISLKSYELHASKGIQTQLFWRDSIKEQVPTVFGQIASKMIFVLTLLVCVLTQSLIEGKN